MSSVITVVYVYLLSVFCVISEYQYGIYWLYVYNICHRI